MGILGPIPGGAFCGVVRWASDVMDGWMDVGYGIWHGCSLYRMNVLGWMDGGVEGGVSETHGIRNDE